MNQLTLIMPFYLNSGMLELQYKLWTEWPDKQKKQLSVILIDDGSPEPAIDVPRPDGLPKLSIYRVLEDRPWHQHAARNLGAHVASDGWMLLTDMDHVLSVDNGFKLIKNLHKLEKHGCYMLDRYEADTGALTMQNGRHKPHPNSFVLTRETFWRIGGYDEDYCGVYGTDGLFRTRASSNSLMLHLSGIGLARYTRELVADASTTTLPRKEGREPDAKRKIADAKALRGETNVIKTLQFPWEQVL